MTEHIFQPDAFATWLASALSTQLARCAGVFFEADGRLRLVFGTEDRPARCWLASAGHGGVPAGSAELVADDQPATRGLLPQLAKRLAKLQSRFHIPLIDLFRATRATEAYTFDDELFRDRLAPFLVRGQTSCGGTLFAGERYDGDCLTYTFEGAVGAVAVEVHLDDEEGSVPADAFLRTPHLALRIAREGGVAGSEPGPGGAGQDAIAAYLGFLLSRCDQPGTRLRRRRLGSAAQIVDPTALEWGGRLEVQFFHEEPGHDLLGIFYALYGIRGPVAALAHSERECANMSTFHPLPYQPLVPSHLDMRPWPGLAERFHLTDLRETDSFMGGEERLEEALAEVSRGEDVEMVFALQTCLGRVIGDDLQGCVRGCQLGTSARLIDRAVGRMETSDPYFEIQRFWGDFLEARRDAELAPRPRSIDLVGYGMGEDRPVGELKRLLAGLDIPVNACLFPGIEWEEAARFDAAELAVVHPWHYIRHVWERLAERRALRSISPPAPFGREGTRRWLAAVAAALGDEGAGAAVRELVERLEAPGGEPGCDLERWSRAREAASGLGICFVLPSTQTHSLLDETRSNGVRWPALIAELGFALTVLCYDPPEAELVPGRVAPAEVARQLAPTSGEALRVARFESPDELAELLTADDIHLIYSELRLDQRVARAGKAAFCIEDIEPGLAGATRTLERLVRRARAPFVSRYRGHLMPREPAPEVPR